MMSDKRFMVPLLPKNRAICQINCRASGRRGDLAVIMTLAGGAPAQQFHMTSIPENLERVRSQIAEAATKSGRAVGEIELVAISKTHEAEKVRAAFDGGQQLFGESRVQEARAKIPLLPSATRWHFVGRLQKNKIRHALPLFELFHSVDSLDLAQQMNRIAEEEGARSRVLLEVNVAGEGSKIGFAPDVLRAEMEALLELPRLTIEGLMTIPPLAPEAEASRQYFIAVRELRDQLAAEFQMQLPRLSMGMSDDFVVAIEEGATLVRVGTAIFGKRTPMQQRKPTGLDSGDYGS
jgi:pyridoxal phosphate enzyme (YggS family)